MKPNNKKYTRYSACLLILLQLTDFITSGILMNLPRFSERNFIINFLYRFLDSLTTLFFVKLIPIIVIMIAYKETEKDKFWTIFLINIINAIYLFVMVKHLIYIL